MEPQTHIDIKQDMDNSLWNHRHTLTLHRTWITVCGTTETHCMDMDNKKKGEWGKGKLDFTGVDFYVKFLFRLNCRYALLCGKNMSVTLQAFHVEYVL